MSSIALALATLNLHNHFDPLGQITSFVSLP
jgi:hypothetical protein